MEDHARVLLGHPHEREIPRRFGGREKSNERLVFEEDKGAPCLEKVEEFRSCDAALDGGVSVVGRGREEIAGEIGVLVEN